jgi:large subunit ribosomal protein L32
MLPVTKTSKARKRIRRSHHALVGTQAIVCPNCGSPKQPHSACRNCGYVRPGLSLKTNEEE